MKTLNRNCRYWIVRILFNSMLYIMIANQERYTCVHGHYGQIFLEISVLIFRTSSCERSIEQFSELWQSGEKVIHAGSLKSEQTPQMLTIGTGKILSIH